MQYYVIDTNVLISAFLKAASTPGNALRKARNNGKLIFTQATFSELITVLYREKFDRYTKPEFRKAFLSSIAASAELIHVTRPIRACQDPADDKFLDAAVHGAASHIITGDEDLLVLHPFMKVAIVTPPDFLAGV